MALKRRKTWARIIFLHNIYINTGFFFIRKTAPGTKETKTGKNKQEIKRILKKFA